MVRTNRQILSGGKRYADKKAKKHRVEEVVFDKDARVEYLTGFHKRKLQRQKKAQEFGKEQERLAKIEERKRLKVEREKDLENQMKQFKKTARDIALMGQESESDDGEDEEEEFTAFDDNDSNNNDVEEIPDEAEVLKQPKGILRQVYHMDKAEQLEDGANIDEETTVVVEAMENPTIANAQDNLDEVMKKNFVNLENLEAVLDKLIKRAQKYAVVCGVAKPKDKKKKKFRYLSKAERREKNRKEKVNSAGFNARKDRK